VREESRIGGGYGLLQSPIRDAKPEHHRGGPPPRWAVRAVSSLNLLYFLLGFGEAPIVLVQGTGDTNPQKGKTPG